MSVDVPRIHICRGPEMREFSRRVWEVRWCVRCRKRLRHVAVFMAPAEPSYYGPHWKVCCAGCGEDHVRFPGTSDGPTLEVAT